MKLGLGRGFTFKVMLYRRYEDWLRTQVQGQEVGEPVVRDSSGEALEEYAPSTPEKEEALFKDGDPELIYRLLLPRGLKPVTVRPAKRV